MTAKPKLILVVEDDPTMRSIVIRVLERDGMQTLNARTGAEAIACIKVDGTRPTVLIIDYTLPDMTGGALLTRLGQLMGEHLPPAILLTGSVEQVDPADASRFDRIVGKPFSLGVLGRHIEALTDS